MARRVKCPACGAANVGGREHCRICATSLAPDRPVPQVTRRAPARRRSSPVFTGLLLVALIALGAFAYVERQNDDPPEVDDKKVAEEALPKPGDLPPGFTETEREVDEADDYEALGCTELDDLYKESVTAVASNELAAGHSLVATEVDIMKSAQDARELVEVLGAVSTRECLERLLSRDSGYTVELDPDAAPVIGDKTVAYRGSVFVSGLQVPFDVVHAQRGRAVVIAFAISVPDHPVTSRQLAEVIIQVLGRLSDVS